MSVTKLRPWCSSGWGHIPCLLSKADLLDPACRTISVGAAFAALKLLAMSFDLFFTGLALLPSGLSIPGFLGGCWRLYVFVQNKIK